MKFILTYIIIYYIFKIYLINDIVT